MRVRQVVLLAAKAVLLAAVLSTTGCLSVLGKATPSHHARIARDIAYGALPRQDLDVYEPVHGPAPLPVVVFFYGGTWQVGEKTPYAFVAKALASRGYVTVVPNYRLYPEVRYPAFLEDSAQAVRWTHDHIAQFGGDPRRIFLMGHSAGGYNAVMLAIDRRWLDRVGVPRADIRGALGLAGMYDFLPSRDHKLMATFGPPSTWPDAEPIHHADPSAPPVWLATGDLDTVVPPSNASDLAQRIHDKGGQAELKVYPSVTHPLLLGAFAGPLRYIAPVLGDAVRFMRAHDVAPTNP